MSDRDKKLLIYLGALIVLAASYFLVGRPFLDKIDEINREKSELRTELDAKRELVARQEEFKKGIDEANNEMQSIIARFPEDNSDEKSLMFISHAEQDIPAWFAQIKFAETSENAIESASDKEAQAETEAVAAAEGESEPAPESVSTEESALKDLIGRDTELGLKFMVKYKGFKDWIAYIRDYKDRMVIKEMEVEYDSGVDLVSGTMTLSQYALLGPGRELPPVVTDVDELGKDNVFVLDGSSPTILDLIGEIASDLIDAIIGGMNGSSSNEQENYFINVTAGSDNTSAKTIGRAKDPSGTTYLTSDKNEKESVTFRLKGANGRYHGEYEMGGFTVKDDDFKKDITGHVVLRVISSSRKDDSDKSAIKLSLQNTSDIPLIVNVENDDPNNPRVEVLDKEGDITVNQ